MTARVYLDWNATAPLRPQARDTMVAAMDAVGNPSSVHAEGRAARAIVERARAQVANAFGAQASDIVFTSGATEGAALVLAGAGLSGSAIEHECIAAHCGEVLPVDHSGTVSVSAAASSVLQAANGETGILQTLPSGLFLSDCVQMLGKAAFGFDWSGVERGLLSAHKLGGPKGVGALVLKRGLDISPQLVGGGQEMGRRSGTENVIGIAGFGAAAAAAQNDLETGAWQRVEDLRNRFEAQILAQTDGVVVVGADVARLPNTSCFATPGWKGDTQVMQMDLAGFAISAGSACSSGSVKASRVLKGLGYNDLTASSAIRVSMGPTTREEDVQAFADTWVAHYKKFKARAA